MDSISAVTSAGSIQADYMKLLITQLQNQDPLEPLDNQEMASQLAQFSQLQQLETMNSSFAEALAYARRSYASSLVGREIAYVAHSEQGAQAGTGVVEQVFNDADGKVLLGVAGETARLGEAPSRSRVSLADVLSVGK